MLLMKWILDLSSRVAVCVLPGHKAEWYGIQFHRREHYAIAASLLARLLHHNRLGGAGLAYLASSLWKLGDQARAERLFDEAERWGEDLLWVYYVRSCRETERSLARGETGGKAAHYCRAAYELACREHNEGVLQESLIGLAACTGDSQEAEALYRQVLSREPHYFEALYGLGLLKARQESWDEAVMLFRQAAEVNKQDAKVQYELGNALCGSEWDAAEQHFRKALRQGFRDRSRALYGIAYCAFHRGERAKAADYASQALKCRPEYDLPRLLLEQLQETSDGTESS